MDLFIGASRWLNSRRYESCEALPNIKAAVPTAVWDESLTVCVGGEGLGKSVSGND
ncbi:hypothetical protein O9929_23945 [Vibrio lentus]|nr:hypothetical protein [Vibrio lentus]